MNSNLCTWCVESPSSKPRYYKTYARAYAFIAKQCDGIPYDLYKISNPSLGFTFKNGVRYA